MDIPGCPAAKSMCVPDEESLLAAGTTPIFEVAVDFEGTVVKGSHKIRR